MPEDARRGNGNGQAPAAAARRGENQSGDRALYAHARPLGPVLGPGCGQGKRGPDHLM